MRITFPLEKHENKTAPINALSYFYYGVYKYSTYYRLSAYDWYPEQRLLRRFVGSKKIIVKNS